MGPFPLRGLSPNMAVYSFKASMEGLPGLLSPQSAKCYYRNDTPSPFNILLARSKSQLLPYTQKMDFCWLGTSGTEVVGATLSATKNSLCSALTYLTKESFCEPTDMSRSPVEKCSSKVFSIIRHAVFSQSIF